MLEFVKVEEKKSRFFEGATTEVFESYNKLNGRSYLFEITTDDNIASVSVLRLRKDSKFLYDQTYILDKISFNYDSNADKKRMREILLRNCIKKYATYKSDLYQFFSLTLANIAY
jgi:homospermidine synthase